MNAISLDIRRNIVRERLYLNFFQYIASIVGDMDTKEMNAENQMRNGESKDIWKKELFSTDAITLVTSQEIVDHKIPITHKHQLNVSTMVKMDIL